jgi:SAM-dependent methyltransferase
MTVADGFIRHPFDTANGVLTSGLIPGRHLKSGHHHDRHATAYYGVAPSVFHALLRRWRRSAPAASMEETNFIDIGAGMGRAVLLAAQLPFRRVIGVELNPALVKMARRNVSVWRKKGYAQAPVSMVCGDAAEVAFPDGPCLVFLFNPFSASVMRKLLATMGKSFIQRPGSLDILYVNNEQEGIFEKHRGFARLFLGKVKRSRADAIADRSILSNQPDGEYASSNYEDCSMWRWIGKHH